ncbi:MAG: U32 family peptidase, partial [Candidatus Electrothrix sp. AR4]|nr:U32 family peptidase [Candidatus Electrothrix sp. AR4]
NKIDANCMQQCARSSSIKNLKNVALCIKKTKGNYHSIYNGVNFLNTDIVTDVPNLFSGFFIDLREITTDTNIAVDKSTLVQLFENHLNGNLDAVKNLRQSIHPSTDSQYKKGI